jgi:hypothetical protein
MKNRVIVLLTAFVLTSSAAAYAHHSLAALYHEDKTARIEGKLVQFSFRSPHSFVAVEALDENGQVQRWVVAWAAAAQLSRQGIGRDFFKPGDHVVITGNPGRNPEDHIMVMRTIFRPSDGFRWGGREGEVVD